MPRRKRPRDFYVAFVVRCYGIKKVRALDEEDALCQVEDDNKAFDLKDEAFSGTVEARLADVGEIKAERKRERKGLRRC